MYRTPELRRFQYYVNPGWTGESKLSSSAILTGTNHCVKAAYTQVPVSQDPGTSIFFHPSIFSRALLTIYHISEIISTISPGALIAGTWAVMQHIGYQGYLESCKNIVLATRRIADAITADIPELYVLGDPPASVVAFASKHPKVDALEVGDGMSRRGWHLAGVNQPPAVHIAVTVCRWI
jgi:hypothetical protein